jgi:hypothetical protein
MYIYIRTHARTHAHTPWHIAGSMACSRQMRFISLTMASLYSVRTCLTCLRSPSRCICIASLVVIRETNTLDAAVTRFALCFNWLGARRSLLSVFGVLCVRSVFLFILQENIDTCVRYMERMARINCLLEMELGMHSVSYAYDFRIEQTMALLEVEISYACVHVCAIHGVWSYHRLRLCLLDMQLCMHVC